MPARDFCYGELDESDRAKVLALFQRLADTGRITNEEKFKRVEGTELFEFKSFQVRLLGDFRPGHRFVVTHGLRKKKDKHSKTDIDTAWTLLKENDQAERSGR
jgi:hypothetical protein